jgi:hypothetical protein
MKIRTKSYIEKLLPEPKPNSEPMLMGIAAAPILQNPMLVAAFLLIISLILIFPMSQFVVYMLSDESNNSEVSD